LGGSFSAKCIKGHPSQLRINAESFGGNVGTSTSTGNYNVFGTLLNCNTQEGFTKLDRKGVIQKCLDNLREDIESGAAERNPERLNRFVLITFADLKKYKFLYWFR
jgi:ubiquitin-like modifier-activating enzyme ATG7